MKKTILILVCSIFLVGTIFAFSMIDFEKKGELKEISAKKLCKAEIDMDKEKKFCKDENKKTKLEDKGIHVDILEHNQTNKEVVKVYAIN